MIRDWKGNVNRKISDDRKKSSFLIISPLYQINKLLSSDPPLLREEMIGGIPSKDYFIKKCKKFGKNDDLIRHTNKKQHIKIRVSLRPVLFHHEGVDEST